ncbi:hypothetical protein N7468_007021 [Penicillium chermesinum]|uniref:Defect at low temperature protein 1 n=1 Tax=Penicillium chermesinum TaxID=63820 RepID=A0A9W9NTB3_9EURO|nr:uncharacterized protein N7468_007021 [Penicillium chermesinum]KAJ5225796.1 hypothetical protein N7468_007021 [Penicillium chermesinum]
MTERLERIWNSSVFFFFALILLCLILLTPADAIYQCYETSRLTNIFFITGAYVITFVLAALIYATRIYTNRSTLAGIPKAWIPVEKEDVNKSVRRLTGFQITRIFLLTQNIHHGDLSNTPAGPPPASPDLPDLPYRTVIQELPVLIEAKAVSLAPADALHTPILHQLDTPGDTGVPDTRVVDILRRPNSMGLRQYIGHLASLGAIDPPELGADFLALYERARFSSHQLHESDFRELMHLFAEILRGMTSLAAPVLNDLRDSASYDRSYTESIIGPSDEEGETDTREQIGFDALLVRSNSLRPSRVSTWGTESGYDTAPVAQSPMSAVSPRSGSNFRRELRTPSTRSLRRVYSEQSGDSGGSVIRLKQPEDPAGLPYVINYEGRHR